MTGAQEIIQNAKAVRARLRRPPNAVPDIGIDLRRHKNPYPVVPIQVIHTPPKIVLKARVVISEQEMESRQIKLENILKAVSIYFDVGIGDLKGPSRRAPITYPRHIAVYLASKHSKNTLSGISRVFKRDHTTSLHSRDKIRDQLEQPLFYPDTTKAVQAIEDSFFANHYRSALAAESEQDLAGQWPTCV